MVTHFHHRTADTPLLFITLELDSAKKVLLSFESLRKVRGGRSQLGFIIIIMDKDNKVNIIQYGLNRCDRVIWSVMVAKVRTLALVYHHSHGIAYMSKQILTRRPDIEFATGSRTIFDVV